MNWSISIAAALLSGVVGLLLAGFIANACTSWYHMSSREGASGYYVMFMGIGGGIAGIVIGLITARVVAHHYGSGMGKELGGSLVVILLLAGTWALLARLLADVPPTLDGRDLILEVEFRFPNNLPDDQPPTATGEWDFRLISLSGQTQRTYRTGQLQTNAVRRNEGHWHLPATAAVFTERGKRVISLTRDGHDAGGFLLALPSRPGPNHLEWSEWLPRQQASGQPWPSDKMAYRFRVQKTVPPPPPKTEAELRSEQDALKEAEFLAISQDSPIETWFRYTAYTQPHTDRALQIIRSRSNCAAELNALVVDEDAHKAHAAMICISQLPNPPKELVTGLEAAGRQIAAHITRFNQTPKEQDPDFALAVDPASRFYGWIPAARRLREQCGADLIPELKTILELSRVRPESTCMRRDICRVASHYLQQWASIAPLPTDPPPR